jgi:DNA-binding response OmpR family regulator
LPQASAEALEPVTATTEIEVCKGTDTILVVEDEEPLLILTCEALADSGYTVLSARDGIQAQEIAKAFREPIDLLLTDLSMPKLGGLALAQKMITLRPGIRILFMTAYSETEPVLPTNLSRTETLSKPFSRHVLLQKVRRILDRTEVPAFS